MLITILCIVGYFIIAVLLTTLVIKINKPLYDKELYMIFGLVWPLTIYICIIGLILFAIYYSFQWIVNKLSG